MSREYIIGHEQISGFKSDPGPVFPWDEFMTGLKEGGIISARSFYVVDETGNQYIIKISTIVGKNEKNIA